METVLMYILGGCAGVAMVGLTVGFLYAIYKFMTVEI